MHPGRLELRLGTFDREAGVSQDRGSPIFPINSRFVIAGDSIPTQALVRQQIMVRTMGRYYWPLGFGKSVAGWTAAQTAADVANVTALSPDVVWLHVGTNDLAGTADTPATIFSNIETCVDAYLSGGAKRVIVDCVMPREAPNALTAEREADRLTLNNLIRGLGSPMVAVVDMETDFVPSTDAYDGLHPNGRGGVKLGSKVARWLNLWTSGSVLPLYTDDSNLIKAAGRHEFSGTGGSKGTGFSGDVATGWGGSSNGSDLTVVCSKTTLNGAPAQRFVISGTSGANSRNIILSSGIPYSGTVGQSYEAWAEFQIEAGSQNCYGVFGISDTAQLQAPNNTQDPIIPSDAYYGVARHAITSQLAGSDTSNNVSFTIQFAAGVVSATITWARPMLRLVS